MPQHLRKNVWQSFRRDRSGVAAVEFALVGLPFFMLVFAIIETSIVIGAGMLLDNAVSDVARQVMTGQIQNNDIDDENFRDKICEKVDFLLPCEGVKIDLRTFSTYGNIPSDVPMKLKRVDDTGFCFDPGAADSIAVLRVFYEWSWVAGFLQRIASDTDGKTILFSIAAFMNEPFGDQVSEHSNCA